MRSATLILAATALLAAPSAAFGPVYLSSSTAPSFTTALSATKKDDVETVKKAAVVASIAEKTGMTKKDSEAALAAVLETIQEEIAAGGKKVQLLGFGTFKLTHRAARKGRNPKTGEDIQIKASNSPSFTASKAFKEKCNE